MKPMKKVDGVWPFRLICAGFLMWALVLSSPAPASPAAGIQLAASQRSLTFRGGRPEEVWIEVQLIDDRTGEPVHRGSPLYLTSDHQGIAFPPHPRLDGRGFARLRLLVHPPGKAHRQRLAGRFRVWVLIDEESGDDTIEAQLEFRYLLRDGQRVGELACGWQRSSRRRISRARLAG